MQNQHLLTHFKIDKFKYHFHNSHQKLDFILRIFSYFISNDND